jgi:hypothetical protein
MAMLATGIALMALRWDSTILKDASISFFQRVGFGILLIPFLLKVLLEKGDEFSEGGKYLVMKVQPIIFDANHLLGWLSVPKQVDKDEKLGVFWGAAKEVLDEGLVPVCLLPYFFLYHFDGN